MAHATTIVGVLLALANLAGAQPGDPNTNDSGPKNVQGLQGAVHAVHKDSVEITGTNNAAAVKLKVTKETTLELADTVLSEGTPKLQTKRIALSDLNRGQPISVITFSLGKDQIILRAVASGPKLSGMDVGFDLKKLGGKIERMQWVNGRLVLSVDLSGTDTNDGNLAVLAFTQSKTIDTLNLSFTKVTDLGLVSLTKFPNLRELRLAGTKVTDAGIESLRRIGTLGTIDLSQTAVTDDGIAELVRDRTMTVCRASAGDKARFRANQEFASGIPQFNYLMINDTYFGRYYTGMASTGPTTPPQDRRREATTYYHRLGPVGSVMGKMEWFKPAGLLDYPSDVRLPASLIGALASPRLLPLDALTDLWSEPAIAVVRFNVGTHAAYCRPYQHMDFYDDSPEIRSFSYPPMGQRGYFGYAHDALTRGCCVRILEGPERATLTKKSPKAFYQAMFVEITRNDLRDVNTQLLTKEAVADMMQCLTKTGLLCFHTSHRYHHFSRPIVDAASSLGLSFTVGNCTYSEPRANPASSQFGSEWVVIARQRECFKGLNDAKVDGFNLGWQTPVSTGRNLWRDGQPHNLKAIAWPPITR